MHIGFKSRTLFVAVSIPLILFLAVSCGGGGSDSVNSGSDNSMSDADFSGDYRQGLMLIKPNSGDGVTVVQEIQSDGNGIFSLRNIFGSGGDANSVDYAVASDGEFSMFDNGINGQLSYDGSIFHLVSTIKDNGLAVFLGIRQGTGLSAADLDGSYHVAILSFSEAEAMPGIVVRRWCYEFDGMGAFWKYTLPIPPDPVPIPILDYIVSDNGALSINGHIGQVSPDGDIFFYVNSSEMAIGVRTSTGMSNDDLIGTYHAISMYDVDFNSPGVETRRGLIDADGNGSATFDLIESSTGLVVPVVGPVVPTNFIEGEDTFTFAVVNDAGEIHDDYGNIGQLSPDRSFFIFADDISNEGPTSGLHIGILQP